MKRKPTRLPCETWEFFSACIHYLGKTTLTALFQRGERQIERWAADPSTSGNQKNPVDRYESLLEKLISADERETAVAAVARQAHIVGCELTDKQMPSPDKSSLELEIIDDLIVKAGYDKVLLDPDSTREECRNAMDEVMTELKENYVRKCIDMGWEP